MKPEIACKEEKLLVGFARKMNQQEAVKHGLFSKVRSEFMDVVDTIENRINPNLLYIAYDYEAADISKEDEEMNYTYYVCVEVSSCERIPDGMVRKVIPQAKYAEFIYDRQEETLNGEKLSQTVYDYIDGIWLPNSGFELADTSDYEVIHEGEDRIHYYVSVK